MSRLGYTRGAWATPIRVYTPPQPPLQQEVTIMPIPQQGPIVHLPTSIPYYDQSRIFKDIKVVADMRQSGTERGEMQTGDDGYLGPGSVAPPVTIMPVKLEMPEKNPLVPIALAIAAFFIFGG